MEMSFEGKGDDGKMIGSVKGKLLVLVSVLGLLGIGVGVTWSLLVRTTAAVDNEFTGGQVNIGVVEGEDHMEDLTDGSGIYMPALQNEPVEKHVAIENIDSESYPTTNAYVRVHLVPVLRNAQGENMGAVSVSYNELENGWVLLDDGYFYYKNMVAPGEATPELIHEVTVTSQIPEDAHLELYVLSEGVAARELPLDASQSDIEKTPVWQMWGKYPPDLNLAD